VLKSGEANFMLGNRSFIRKKTHSQKTPAAQAGAQKVKQGEIIGFAFTESRNAGPNGP
jgi:hypothetical protein